MAKTWLIAISLILILIVILWRLTRGYLKEGTGLVYWQVVAYTSTAITLLIMYILKWTNILNF
jgi:hypothetical protein